MTTAPPIIPAIITTKQKVINTQFPNILMKPYYFISNDNQVIKLLHLFQNVYPNLKLTLASAVFVLPTVFDLLKTNKNT